MNQLNRLEKEFQIEELKKYAFNILKYSVGLYCVYNIIMLAVSYMDYYPILISLSGLAAIILLFILPFTLIHNIYKFFKTLISPAKIRK